MHTSTNCGSTTRQTLGLICFTGMGVKTAEFGLASTSQVLSALLGAFCRGIGPALIGPPLVDGGIGLARIIEACKLAQTTVLS